MVTIMENQMEKQMGNEMETISCLKIINPRIRLLEKLDFEAYIPRCSANQSAVALRREFVRKGHCRFGV